MTKIPSELIEKLGLVESNLTVKDSYAKDAKIYMVPAISDETIKVYLAECDLDGNTDSKGMINVFVKGERCVHSKVSMDLLQSRIAMRVLLRIKDKSVKDAVYAVADKIFTTLQQEAAVRAARSIINKKGP